MRRSEMVTRFKGHPLSAYYSGAGFSYQAEQHEDINLITLLVGASAGGLELLDMNNEWKAITPEADEIVVNVGDMLQKLTNNFLRSTTGG